MSTAFREGEILTTELMPLGKVRHDGQTQSRVSIDNQTLADYVEALEEGATFPPIVVYFDGKDHWLADGFHRYLAHVSAGRDEVLVEVRMGSQADAIAHSAGSNDGHGLRRSVADKRHAVRMLLECPAYQRKSRKWFQQTARASWILARDVIDKWEAERSANGQPVDRDYIEGADGILRPARLKTPDSAAAATNDELPDSGPPPVPPGDKLGRLVPDKFIDAHATARTIHGLVLAIGKLQADIKALQDTPGAERVDFAELDRLLSKAKQKLKDAKYHTECPTCLGKRKPVASCDHCSGRGWVTAGRYRRLSDEDKRKLQPVVNL